jgi:hypothetical protein
MFASAEFAILLLCAYAWYRKEKWGAKGTIFVGLAFLAFFFQLPLSTVLWTKLPDFFLVQFPFRFLAVMAAAIPLVLLMKPTPEKLRFPVYVSLLCLATRAVRIAVVHCNSSAKMYRSNWNAFRWPPGYPIRGS